VGMARQLRRVVVGMVSQPLRNGEVEEAVTARTISQREKLGMGGGKGGLQQGVTALNKDMVGFV